jgi:2-haloacid dehalogenase
LSATKACVFDAYGTLFDVNAAAERCRGDLGDKWQPLAQLWRTKQLEYCWLLSLRGEYSDFWHVTGFALDYAMASVGITDDMLRSRLMELYFTLDTYADTKDTMTRIKDANRKTAILSNGSKSMLVGCVNHAKIGSLLDRVFSADEVEIYKPHTKMYQLAVDGLHVEPNEICFVSANGWDVSGAANFGFRVVWINRLAARRENTPGEPEYEIKSLSELPALLGI